MAITNLLRGADARRARIRALATAQDAERQAIVRNGAPPATPGAVPKLLRVRSSLPGSG